MGKSPVVLLLFSGRSLSFRADPIKASEKKDVRRFPDFNYPHTPHTSSSSSDEVRGGELISLPPLEQKVVVGPYSV